MLLAELEQLATKLDAAERELSKIGGRLWPEKTDNPPSMAIFHLAREHGYQRPRVEPEEDFEKIEPEQEPGAYEEEEEEEGDSSADTSFKLSFTKTRRRTPANKGDFTPQIISLKDGVWKGEKSGVSPQFKIERDIISVLEFSDAATDSRPRLLPHQISEKLAGRGRRGPSLLTLIFSASTGSLY
jgi:hypothetical protein